MNLKKLLEENIVQQLVNGMLLGFGLILAYVICHLIGLI